MKAKARNLCNMISFAHLGLKRLQDIVKVSKAGSSVLNFLDEYYSGRNGWRNEKGAVLRVAGSLAQLAEISAKKKILLVDTQRNQNQFWDKGGWSRVFDLYPELEFSIIWIPYLCPEKTAFRNFSESNMTFDVYCFRYLEYIKHVGAFAKAVEIVEHSNSMGEIPVIYCGDPFLPEFSLSEHSINPIWSSSEFRLYNCHRYVLFHELIKYYWQQEVDFKAYEIDVNNETVIFSN